MSKPSKYEPVVIKLLTEHPEGKTAASLVDELGMSVPHAYRTVKKLHKDGALKVIGKNDTGAALYAVETVTPTMTVPTKRVRLQKVDVIKKNGHSEYRLVLSTDDPEYVSGLLNN